MSAWEQLQEAVDQELEPGEQQEGGGTRRSTRSSRRVAVAERVGADPTPVDHSSLDPVAQAAKLAATRERNRIAQQRFRDRQRQKERQQGQRCNALQQQIEEAQAERERLQRQSLVYTKVLAVRDAILQTYTTLRPSGQQSQQQEQREGAAQAAEPLPSLACTAAQGLARALDELPSEREMEDTSPENQLQPTSVASVEAVDSTAGLGQPDMQAGTQEAQGGSSSREGSAGQGPASDSSGMSSDTTGALPEASQAPAFQLGKQHRSGTASQLDGSALREVESIPPVRDQAAVAQVDAMTDPEHLVTFFRQWIKELTASYAAAKAAGFDEVSVRDVEAKVERMSQIWWHVGQLKPDYLCYLAHVALPENSGQLPLWREIAEELLSQFDERSITIVRHCWHNYCKRMAKIAVGVSRWVRKLQQFAVQPPMDGLVTNAHSALELMDITNHMAAAVQEEYIASMEFVAAQFPATSTLLKAYVNVRSAPYLPDLVAIVYQIIQLDNERRQPHGGGPLNPPLLQ